MHCCICVCQEECRLSEQIYEVQRRNKWRGGRRHPYKTNSAEYGSSIWSKEIIARILLWLLKFWTMNKNEQETNCCLHNTCICTIFWLSYTIKCRLGMWEIYNSESDTTINLLKACQPPRLRCYHQTFTN